MQKQIKAKGRKKRAQRKTYTISQHTPESIRGRLDT